MLSEIKEDWIEDCYREWRQYGGEIDGKTIKEIFKAGFNFALDVTKEDEKELLCVSKGISKIMPRPKASSNPIEENNCQ